MGMNWRNVEWRTLGLLRWKKQSLGRESWRLSLEGAILFVALRITCESSEPFDAHTSSDCRQFTRDYKAISMIESVVMSEGALFLLAMIHLWTVVVCD